MRKKIVSLTLSPGLVDDIDQTSKAMGMSRSEYVEMMLKKGFHFTDDVQDAVEEIAHLQERIKKNLKIEE